MFSKSKNWLSYIMTAYIVFMCVLAVVVCVCAISAEKDTSTQEAYKCCNCAKCIDKVDALEWYLENKEDC